MVPVLRNADQRDVFQIARELTTMAVRARAVEFSLDDLRGGTFTVSNLGAVGGTPIARPSSTIPKWPTSCWAARDGCFACAKSPWKIG